VAPRLLPLSDAWHRWRARVDRGARRGGGAFSAGGNSVGCMRGGTHNAVSTDLAESLRLEVEALCLRRELMQAEQAEQALAEAAAGACVAAAASTGTRGVGGAIGAAGVAGACAARAPSESLSERERLSLSSGSAELTISLASLRSNLSLYARSQAGDLRSLSSSSSRLVATTRRLAPRLAEHVSPTRLLNGLLRELSDGLEEEILGGGMCSEAATPCENASGHSASLEVADVQRTDGLLDEKTNGRSPAVPTPRTEVLTQRVAATEQSTRRVALTARALERHNALDCATR